MEYPESFSFYTLLHNNLSGSWLEIKVRNRDVGKRALKSEFRFSKIPESISIILYKKTLSPFRTLRLQNHA